MKSYACTKCGSVDVFIQDRGNQKALICGDCSAWLKWIGKAELPLVERYIASNSDIEKTKKSRIFRSGIGAAGRIRTAHITPRNLWFRGDPGPRI